MADSINFDDAIGAAVDAAVNQGLSADQAATNAEVILIMTSLGSVRRYYFASRRAKHFLDCKGYIYYLVDANRDVSSGAELLDSDLLEKWKKQQRLRPDTSRPEEHLLLPQILIDGVSIGEDTNMRDLEEDGDLDYLYSRMTCPACLEERPAGAQSCPSCQQVFRTVVPPESVYSGKILQWCRGQVVGSAEGYFEHPTFQHAKSIKLGHHRLPSYEEVFGEAPEE